MDLRQSILRTGQKTKSGEELSLAVGAAQWSGLFHSQPPPGPRGTGDAGPWQCSGRGLAGAELPHSCPSSPHSDVWNELTEQAPLFPWRQAGAQESCRLSPAWAPPPPPFTPLGSTEIRLGKRKWVALSPQPWEASIRTLPLSSVFSQHPTKLASEGVHHIGGGAEDPPCMDGKIKSQR